MKRLRLSLLFSALIFVLTACDSDGLYRLTLVAEGEHTFLHNLEGDLIMLGGSATLPAGTMLDGSAHIFSGSLNVNGHITGDVSFLNGELILGPTARIVGNLNLGGGSYLPSPAAVIAGRINTGTGIPLPNLPERKVPSLWILLLRTLVSGSFLGSAAIGLVHYAPGAIKRVEEAAIHYSPVSAAMGLLVAVVGISLLITMAYTILLIPVTLMGMAVLAVGMLYGWISLGISLGRLVFRILKCPVGPSAMAFFGTLAFMFGLELLSSIPVIGGLLGIAIACIGLGAIALTRFGLRRFVPATEENLIK